MTNHFAAYPMFLGSDMRRNAFWGGRYGKTLRGERAAWGTLVLCHVAVVCALRLRSRARLA